MCLGPAIGAVATVAPCGLGAIIPESTSNVNCAIGAQVYAQWNTSAGAAAHEVLAATRKAVISVPLIPGLKALVGRNTGDARWNNIRPPHLPLTAAQQTSLFRAFDECGLTLPKAA